MSSLIQRSVTVCLDLEVMHSLGAHQFQSKETLSIHAIRHHVVKIRYVRRRMVLPSVAVFHRILEMHTELDVGQSAFTIRIVPAEWHAFDSIAGIHVQVYAVHLLNVLSSTMCRYALAQEPIKVIHSPAVDQFHDYRNHLKTCVNLVHVAVIAFAELSAIVRHALVNQDSLANRQIADLNALPAVNVISKKLALTKNVEIHVKALAD